MFYHTVALDRDMNECEVSPDEAKKLKQQHGDKVMKFFNYIPSAVNCTVITLFL